MLVGSCKKVAEGVFNNLNSSVFRTNMKYTLYIVPVMHTLQNNTWTGFSETFVDCGSILYHGVDMIIVTMDTATRK